MIKCDKCETMMPDGAKFCPKCGAPMTAAQPAQTEQPASKQKQASGLAGILKHFWVLFATTGLLAYLLIDLAGMYLNVSVGFSVTLAVFALLCGIAFCTLCVLNKLCAGEEDKKKYATRNNVCFAVGIILSVVVLLGSIAIFVMAG